MMAKQARKSVWTLAAAVMLFAILAVTMTSPSFAGAPGKELKKAKADLQVVVDKLKNSPNNKKLLDEQSRLEKLVKDLTPNTAVDPKSSINLDNIGRPGDSLRESVSQAVDKDEEAQKEAFFAKQERIEATEGTDTPGERFYLKQLAKGKEDTDKKIDKLYERIEGLEATINCPNPDIAGEAAMVAGRGFMVVRVPLALQGKVNIKVLGHDSPEEYQAYHDEGKPFPVNAGFRKILVTTIGPSDRVSSMVFGNIKVSPGETTFFNFDLPRKKLGSGKSGVKTPPAGNDDKPKGGDDDIRNIRIYADPPSGTPVMRQRSSGGSYEAGGTYGCKDCDGGSAREY